MNIAKVDISTGEMKILHSQPQAGQGSTLVTAGDHDECDPALSRVMHEKIPGSRLVIFPESGHMTFVDQPALFDRAVDDFLHAAR